MRVKTLGFDKHIRRLRGCGRDGHGGQRRQRDAKPNGGGLAVGIRWSGALVGMHSRDRFSLWGGFARWDGEPDSIAKGDILFARLETCKQEFSAPSEAHFRTLVLVIGQRITGSFWDESSLSPRI